MWEVVVTLLYMSATGQQMKMIIHSPNHYSDGAVCDAHLADEIGEGLAFIKTHPEWEKVPTGTEVSISGRCEEVNRQNT